MYFLRERIEPFEFCQGCCELFSEWRERQLRSRRGWHHLYGGGAVLPHVGKIVSFGRPGPRTEILICHRHSCELGRFSGFGAPLFCASEAALLGHGLNSHSVRLRVYLGLLLPVPVADKDYRCRIPVRCRLELFGALRYYWGAFAEVKGTYGISYHQGGPGNVRLQGGWEDVNFFVNGPVFGDLQLLPLEGVACAAFGHREDVTVFSAHLQWVETHSPHWASSRPVRALP